MNLPESEMSLPVMTWLDGLGYVPYAEVPHYGACVDIVAIHDPGPVLIAVEMKTSLTKQVIYQAYMANLFADYSYCAVSSKPKPASIETCRERKIGILRVVKREVEVILEPEKAEPWNVRSKVDFVEGLRLRCPGGIAGKPNLKGEGPAQECARRVKVWRVEHPRATWREIYEHVDNHYANMTSMRGALMSRGLM